MGNQSIVKKQVLLYGATTLTCILILGGILSMIYTQHYVQAKEEELIEQGRKVSMAFTNAYRTGNLNNLSYELQVLEEYMDAKVLMINEDGVVVLASPGMKNVMIGRSFVYPKLTQGLLEGNIIVAETDPIAGGFDVATLLVGYPLKVGDMAGIFMCHPMPEMDRSLTSLHQAGAMGTILVLVIAMFVSYITSKKITQPLKEMNEMAKVIAGGDYDKRVRIYGEDEVGELGRSFNHMARSIQNNDKIRRDFIANISHDLRSPLTSMHGFLTAMLDGTVPAHKQERYLKIVLEETNRLTRITADIMDLSRAQSSKILLDVAEFDLNELIRDSIICMEPQLEEKELNIKAIYQEKVTMVFGDKDKITRIVQNLFGNAIKFSYSGQSIEVETTIQNKKKVLVSIKDKGIGISKENQKYIFDRFYKADATRNEDKEGSGLGLAIVRELLHAHGEGISVKSNEGEGTTFVFSLKLWNHN